MKNNNNTQWLSVLGSIGIGIAAYSMMNGRGDQMANIPSNLANMGNMGNQNQ